jgi:hypothetical protein
LKIYYLKPLFLGKGRQLRASLRGALSPIAPTIFVDRYCFAPASIQAEIASMVDHLPAFAETCCHRKAAGRTMQG